MEEHIFPLDRRPLGRAGVPIGDPGPPLWLAHEIGIFVRVSDDDAGVVIRFVLAQRGTRGYSTSASDEVRGPLAARRIFSQRPGTGFLGRRHSANFAVTEFSEVRRASERCALRPKDSSAIFAPPCSG